MQWGLGKGGGRGEGSEGGGTCQGQGKVHE
jgi:hypothetical protein